MDYENRIPLRRVCATFNGNVMIVWQHLRVDIDGGIDDGISYYDLECLAIIGITQ